MKSIFFTLTVLLFTLPAQAEMLRVVAIQDGRTVAVDRNGTRTSVRLAGVAVTDELHARELLRWTLLGFWVKLEPAANGELLVWRSPDAMFINRELVLRGYARATLEGIAPDTRVPMIYLGEGPSGERRVTVEAEPATGSGIRRRSRGKATSPRRGARPSPGRSGSARRGPS
ncbi:MAG TPA: hypothetical protein VNA69_09410 [Thermoanaerobaculia bacterium]|nr:hypothetical protein [Thermoanaerobaculia bacterium]